MCFYNFCGIYKIIFMLLMIFHELFIFPNHFYITREVSRVQGQSIRVKVLVLHTKSNLIHGTEPGVSFDYNFNVDGHPNKTK